MFSEAVLFANSHPWSSGSENLLKPRRSLVLLPEGFEEVLSCFETASMTAQSMKTLDDVDPSWFEEELSAVVLFSPVRYEEPLRWKNVWYSLMHAIAKGAELIALPGPQDDENWGKSVDLIRDFMEETAAQRPILSQRMKCLLPYKSKNNMRNAPFRMLADRINLVTGPHYTQSAAKRFWTATLEKHNSLLQLPAFHRVTVPNQGSANPMDITDVHLLRQGRHTVIRTTTILHDVRFVVKEAEKPVVISAVEALCIPGGAHASRMNLIAVVVTFCISFSLAEKCIPDPYNFDYATFRDFKRVDKQALRQNLERNFTRGDLFLLWQTDVDPDYYRRKNAIPTVVFPRDAGKEPFFFIYYPAKSSVKQFVPMSPGEFIDFLYNCRYSEKP
ncbi:hypothetical protein V3C99_009593 [Haemonchus contortus]